MSQLYRALTCTTCGDVLLPILSRTSAWSSPSRRVSYIKTRRPTHPTVFRVFPFIGDHRLSSHYEVHRASGPPGSRRSRHASKSKSVLDEKLRKDRLRGMSGRRVSSSERRERHGLLPLRRMQSRFLRAASSLRRRGMRRLPVPRPLPTAHRRRKLLSGCGGLPCRILPTRTPRRQRG